MSPDMSTPHPLLTTERTPIVPPLVLTDIKVEKPSREDDFKTMPVMNLHYLLPLNLLPVLHDRQRTGRSQSSLRAPLPSSSSTSSSSSLAKNHRIKKSQVSGSSPIKKPLRPISPQKAHFLKNTMDPQEKTQMSGKSKQDTLLCHICGEIARWIIKLDCMTCPHSS